MHKNVRLFNMAFLLLLASSDLHLHATVNSGPPVLAQRDNVNEIMTSTNLDEQREKLQIKFKAIEELYIRSLTEVQKFDRLLKEFSTAKSGDLEQFNKKIFETGLKARLLALHTSKHEQENEIISIYSKFNEIVNNPKTSPQKKVFALAAFNQIGSYYNSLDREFAIAHYQVASELFKLKNNILLYQSGVSKIITAPSIKNPNKQIHLYQKKYETKEVEKSLNNLSKDYLYKKTEVSNLINKSAYMIQANLIIDNGLVPLQPELQLQPQRQPQPLYPTIGPDGNITGNDFAKGVWAITFDDGPHPIYTNQILANLNDNNIKATFFSLAMNVLKYPEITLGLQNAGMEIANHSHNHADLTKVDAEQLDFQITQASEKIKSVTGISPRFFRSPYGAGSTVSRVRSIIAADNMIHVYWNVDSLDWQDRNPESIIKRVKDQMALSKKGGGVILFHDIHPQSVIASKAIMEYFSEENKTNPDTFKLNTISAIVDDFNNEIQKSPGFPGPII